MMSRKKTMICLFAMVGLLSCLVVWMSLDASQVGGIGSGNSLQSKSGLKNNPARNKKPRTHLDLRMWPSIEDLRPKVVGREIG
jgi:hypothetical protein